MNSRSLRLLLVLLLTLCAACTPARKKLDGHIVRHVAFEGNEGLFSGQNDLQLRNQLEQKASSPGLLTWPFMYSVTPEPFKAQVLPRDAYRLEVWYAHNGWFDAQVRGWETRRIRPPTDHRAGVVDIIGVVAAGTPSTIRSMRIEGLNPNLALVGKSVLRRAPVREGDQFNLAYVQATQDLLVDALVDLSHAYAQVELRMEASPEEHAVDVVFVVDAGISCHYGELELVGNEVIPDKFVLQNIKISPGDAYSLAGLHDAQRRLFDMGTFSIVTVKPDLSDPTVAAVPVEVRVTESRFRTLRVGVGFDYDGFLVSPRVSTRLRHVNFLRQLMRIELGAQAGVAYDVSTEVTTSIPTWNVSTAVSYPRIASQKVAIELKGQWEQDVYSGLWAFQRPEADLHVVWRFSDDIVVRAGPHVEQYSFIGDFGPKQETAQQRLFGIEAAEGFYYQLTALDQYVTWDWRDDPQRTTRGSYYNLILREALPLSSAGYSYLSVIAEARRFSPIKIRHKGRSSFPFVFAGKLRGQYIQPFGDSQIPLPERAFLGGPNSLRGFRLNQVGPYETLCTYDEVTSGGGLFQQPEETYTRVTHYHLPKGGTVALESTAELRYEWIYGVTLAAFTDVGLLSPSLAEVSPEDLRASAGVGMRYDTLIGPIRFDLSFRPLYPEDAGPDRYRLCRNPEDELARPYDFFSMFRGLRDPADHPGFASVFFLTFGEAL